MNLISQETINLFTSGYGVDLFDTLTSNRTRGVSIIKEPIKTFDNIEENNFAGYGNVSNLQNIRYTQVSGFFPAIIKIDKEQSNFTQEDLNTKTYKGETFIKVEEDCKNFIENGKNLFFIINDQQFDDITDQGEENFLGKKFYLYKFSKVR